MFRILTQPIWRPFGTVRDNFHINFHNNFHTNFTQFSHPGRGGHLKPFWACPGGGQPSSPALRFALISGPLLQRPGRIPGKGARGIAPHETSRTQSSTAFRCVAICCGMAPLTWWRHPGPAPRCVTTAAPQSENSREIFGPTEILGARRRQKKVLQVVSRLLGENLLPPTPPVDS